jgi:hypothetical protein
MKMIILLGPQRPKPTVRAAITEARVDGPVAVVTAGWQEYELDDSELMDSLPRGATNLRLHARGEDVFARDPELATAYRARQERLRQYQDFYRLRLESAVDLTHIIGRAHSDPAVLEAEGEVSVQAIRDLDRVHLERCRAAHDAFEQAWKPAERDVVAHHRAQLAAQMQQCAAMVIAGGHVAVLLNRLRLFGIADLLGDRPVITWSAGAMALGERTVLFHDTPPQGPGIMEILDTGLGLFPHAIPFPDPELRLRLDDSERVSLCARRFRPALCLAMTSGSHITFDDSGWRNPFGIKRMKEDGSLEILGEPREG